MSAQRYIAVRSRNRCCYGNLKIPSLFKVAAANVEVKNIKLFKATMGFLSTLVEAQNISCYC
jgi:hypothetical protein